MLLTYPWIYKQRSVQLMHACAEVASNVHVYMRVSQGARTSNANGWSNSLWYKASKLLPKHRNFKIWDGKCRGNALISNGIIKHGRW
jgi:hypothetical protein